MKRFKKLLIVLSGLMVAALVIMPVAQAAPARRVTYYNRYGYRSAPSTYRSTSYTSGSASSPASTPSASSVSSASSLEGRMINLINEDRAAEGLKPLRADSSLRTGAMKHSQDMAANSFFSHTSPTYGTFSERAKASGASVSAENLSLNGSVERAHASLMGSAGHRANIMNANYTRVGIGIVYSSQKGGYYITQWFGR